MTVPSHREAWIAAGIRRAATEAGVELPLDYARAIAVDGLRRGDDLAVTRIGAGIVIHTAPETSDRLPVVVGYAETGSQYYRDGSEHQAAAPSQDRGISL